MVVLGGVAVSYARGTPMNARGTPVSYARGTPADVHRVGDVVRRDARARQEPLYKAGLHRNLRANLGHGEQAFRRSASYDSVSTITMRV
jgi:hypothetical protein